jgi:hypothetical protein
MWFPMMLTLFGRLTIAYSLLFGGRGYVLYVWCRSIRVRTPELWHPRLGLFVSGGAFDVLECDKRIADRVAGVQRLERLM